MKGWWNYKIKPFRNFMVRHHPSSHLSLEVAVAGLLLEYVEGKILEHLPPELFNDNIATCTLEVVTLLLGISSRLFFILRCLHITPLFIAYFALETCTEQNRSS